MKKLFVLLGIVVYLTSCTNDPAFVEPDWFTFAPDENFEGSAIDMSE